VACILFAVLRFAIWRSYSSGSFLHAHASLIAESEACLRAFAQTDTPVAAGREATLSAALASDRAEHAARRELWTRCAT
jgi:DNA polymerase III psi subunit